MSRAKRLVGGGRRHHVRIASARCSRALFLVSAQLATLASIGCRNTTELASKERSMFRITGGIGRWMDVGEELMSAVASSKADYHFAPSAEDLETNYLSIATAIQSCQ